MDQLSDLLGKQLQGITSSDKELRLGFGEQGGPIDTIVAIRAANHFDYYYLSTEMVSLKFEDALSQESDAGIAPFGMCPHCGHPLNWDDGHCYNAQCPEGA